MNLPYFVKKALSYVLPMAEYKFTSKDAESIYGGRIGYAMASDAGIDLRIMHDATLPPNGSVVMPSGVAINLLSKRHAAIVIPRSGFGSRGIVLGNLVGLIDCGYQGEVKLVVWNRSGSEVRLYKGDRVAQLVMLPVARPTLSLVSKFAASERGEQGFGSTGKA